MQDLASKQKNLITLFSECSSREEIYKKIIELGAGLNQLSQQEINEEMRVSGCQSLMYLSTVHKNGKLYFSVYSDALISRGLAALLIQVFNEESAETIVKSDLDFLGPLHLSDLLTPSRSNGLSSLFLKMKQSAINFLINS